MKQNKISSVLNLAVVTASVLFLNANYISFFKECVGNDLRVIKMLFPIGIALFGVFAVLSYFVASKRKKDKNVAGILLIFVGVFVLGIGVFTSYFLHTLVPVLLIQTAVLVASYVNCLFNFISFAFLGAAVGEELHHCNKVVTVLGLGVGAIVSMILNFVLVNVGAETIFVVLGAVAIVVAVLNMILNKSKKNS